MARRNLNPIVRHLVILERKDAKTVSAYGCFMDRARGEVLSAVQIKVDAVNQNITSKISTDDTYVGVIQYTTNLQEYVITSIYEYAPQTECYIVCKGISKDYEAAEVIEGLSEFYKRNGLEFNEKTALSFAIDAIENEEPLVIGAPLRFSYIAKIVPNLKIPAANYYFEIMTKEEMESGHFNPVFMKDAHDDWNTVFAPIPSEKIEFGTYIMPESLSAVVSTILPAYMNSNYHNIVLGFVGDSGNGKTVAAQHIARYLTERLGREIRFTKVNVPFIQRASEFFLERDFVDGSTVNQFTNFYNMLTGGDAVILLDEVNRVPSDVLNAILGVTDGSEYFSLRGTDHKIGKNITFILTYNVGYQYTGTFDIDNALVSRTKVRVDFGLPNRDELFRIAAASFPDAPPQIIDGMTLLCHELNKLKKANRVTIDVSVRSLLNWLFVYAPFEYRPNMLMDALMLSMVNFAADDEEKATIIGAIKLVFNGVI